MVSRRASGAPFADPQARRLRARSAAWEEEGEEAGRGRRRGGGAAEALRGMSAGGRAGVGGRAGIGIGAEIRGAVLVGAEVGEGEAVSVAVEGAVEAAHVGGPGGVTIGAEVDGGGVCAEAEIVVGPVAVVGPGDEERVGDEVRGGVEVVGGGALLGARGDEVVVDVAGGAGVLREVGAPGVVCGEDIVHDGDSEVACVRVSVPVADRKAEHAAGEGVVHSGERVEPVCLV